MRNVTVYFNDGKFIESGNLSKRQERVTYIFYPGDYCAVEPVNSNKKKHRGRVCRLRGSYHGANMFKIRVKFLDTGQLGYVDAEDLIPASPEQISSQLYRE